jgi:hypothetical protein
MTGDKHFLRWEFGCDKMELPEKIEAKLKKAVSASYRRREGL